MDGRWIKLHPKMLENPVVMKDADHCAVWIYLLLNAVWKSVDVMFGGERLTLAPGQLTIGRKKIASDLRINESKVQRILKLFENEHQIEQRTDRQCRLITITRWADYQDSEQRTEQRVNNDRTTSEQRVNTKVEGKKEKKDKKDKTIYSLAAEEIVAYLNELTGKHYRATTPKTRELIKARIQEGFTVEDFKTVIYKKAKEWHGDPKMEKFIRPETLFGTKFEGYLNQSEAPKNDVEAFYDMMQEWSNEDE